MKRNELYLGIHMAWPLSIPQLVFLAAGNYHAHDSACLSVESPTQKAAANLSLLSQSGGRGISALSGVR